MILIGLIFASGFRRKAGSYFSPPSSLASFIKVCVAVQGWKALGGLGWAVPAALLHCCPGCLLGTSAGLLSAQGMWHLLMALSCSLSQWSQSNARFSLCFPLLQL